MTGLSSLRSDTSYEHAAAAFRAIDPPPDSCTGLTLHVYTDA